MRPFHAAALMGALGVVDDEVGVERDLHLLDGLEPGGAAFDTEVLVEQRAMEALDDAVGLRPLHAGLAVLDALELEEQLVGMVVHAASELAAVVGQHGVHFDAMRLEGRQHVGVKQMHGGDRHLVGVEPSKRESRMAIDHRLEINLPNAF